MTIEQKMYVALILISMVSLIIYALVKDDSN